ncbi:MAG: acyltransferase family protein [Candidatus Ornithomonoglobus sp.]
MLKRNYSIDALRTLLIFFVVCVHFPLKGFIGTVLKEAGQNSVPLFFMITGYFLYNEDRENMSGKAFKQAKHIAWLCFWGFMMYFVYFLLTAYISGMGITVWLREVFTMKAVIKFLVLNDLPMKNTSLWFLFAMLYDLIIIGAVSKLFHIKRLFFLVVVLLAVRLSLGTYSCVLWGRKPDICLTRNFAVSGMMSMLYGCLIASKKDKLCRMFGNKLLCAVAAAGTAVTVCVYILLKRNGLLNYADYYISTLFITGAVMLLCIKNPQFLKNETVCAGLAAIGRKYALYVYVFHRLVSLILDKAVESLCPGFWNGYIAVKAIPVFVCAFALAVCYLNTYEKIKSLIRNRE